MKTTTTLSGQTILIIGGTSGIGFGVAIASLSNGTSRLIISGSSSISKIDDAITRLRSLSNASSEVKIEGILIDGKDLKGVEEKVKRLGEINHLVYTGGDSLMNVMKDVRELDLSDAKEKGFEVRFWAALAAAKSAVFPPEGGSITFTSGVLTSKPIPTTSLAAAVGSAVQGATKGLAVDLAPKNVRVNCVSPGWVDTEAFNGMPDEHKKAMFDNVAKGLLAKRVGVPADLAEAYVFLMKCGFINGEVINVNGGQLLAPSA